MPISRYSRSDTFGNHFGTSYAISAIRTGIANRTIAYTEMVVQGKERLDIIAGRVYGDGRLWWVIAAGSAVGWGLQVPEGTKLKIPDLQGISRIVG